MVFPQQFPGALLSVWGHTRQGKGGKIGIIGVRIIGVSTIGIIGIIKSLTSA